VTRSTPFLRPSIAIQAKMSRSQPKFYPNLNPAAAVKVDRKQILRLESFFDQFRLKRADAHGQLVANSKYIFVRMLTGELYVHPTLRHPVLADGKAVLYAGEIYFDNGRLEWWSNGSGNYRPDPEHAEQAELPMQHFYTFDEILKGKHKAGKQNRPVNY
jgi:hypothetical protein